MQRLFSIFPESWPGVGLIFLRLVVCSSVVVQGFQILVLAPTGESGKWILGLASILVALFVLIGFLTPVASIVATLGYGIIGIWIFLFPNITTHFSNINLLSSSLASAALGLLGPGAYSIDARIFGRREIIIPESGKPSE